jgi:hypothetical protein
MHTDIHALSGIRTHDPSVREGEDGSCRRPRGHFDRVALTAYSSQMSFLFMMCCSMWERPPYSKKNSDLQMVPDKFPAC